MADKHPPDPAVHPALIQGIVDARVDLMDLAQAHGMTTSQLADWALDEHNRRVLCGLCVLADLQTQILLSRYRLLAAGRLIKLATEEGQAGPDVARRACVDLLKMDLKRADEPEPDQDGGPEGLAGCGVTAGPNGSTHGLLDLLLTLREKDLSRAGIDPADIRSLVYRDTGARGRDVQSHLHKDPPKCAADDNGE